MSRLDDADKKILNRIQSDFPMESKPYLALAAEFGLSEKEVLERVTRLKRDGIIRRIGANLTPARLGFVSTLCAAAVPEDRIDTFARCVNRYDGVTHNYVRQGTFNVWFTFIAPSMEEIESRLVAIAEETGIEKILNLPTTRVFKIRAQFDL